MRVSAAAKVLFEATIRELFQAERSATRHPRIEAERLGPCPPGDAMEEIARHAAHSLDELGDLARLHGMDPATTARAIGRALSVFRDRLADLTTTSEQSYRVTLLGVRHGVDLVRLLHELAASALDDEVKAWTEAWLTRRLELVEDAETALTWFAQHPDDATAPVRKTPLAVVTRSALRALGKVDAAVSYGH